MVIVASEVGDASRRGRGVWVTGVVLQRSGGGGSGRVVCGGDCADAAGASRERALSTVEWRMQKRVARAGLLPWLESRHSTSKVADNGKGREGKAERPGLHVSPLKGTLLLMYDLLNDLL